MKFIINGRRYHIKESVLFRLRGIILITLGIMCCYTHAEGAAVFMILYGILLYISGLGRSKRKGVIYRIARAYILDKDSR